jgi:hypothetical protein
MGENSNLFCQNWAPKILESQKLFFRGRLVSRIFENSNLNSAALWRIFSSNKSAPAIRRKGSTNRAPKKQEIGGVFV